MQVRQSPFVATGYPRKCEVAVSTPAMTPFAPSTDVTPADQWSKAVFSPGTVVMGS